jgi:hypothetical protein
LTETVSSNRLQDSYEKYRDKQKEREQEWERDRGQREKRSPRRKSRSRTPEKKSRESGRKRSRSRTPEKTNRDSRNGSSKRTWVRPMLRVRIVDKHFRFAPASRMFSSARPKIKKNLKLMWPL